MSDLSTISVQNHNAIEQWRDCLERGELPISAGARVNPQLRARRHALSDLMCNLQLRDEQHALLDGNHEDPALRQLREDGLVEVDGDYLKMTEAGRYTLHQVWGDASPSFRWKNLV
jgi:oxygen-independent coproporphyrinogen-3 oxidase